jgi:predicted CXXCH cytochrome family protein
VTSAPATSRGWCAGHAAIAPGRARRASGAMVLAALAAVAGCAGTRSADTARPTGGAAAAAPGAPSRARFVPVPEAEAAAVKNVHRFRGASLCQACHAPSGALAAEPVALCVRCHAQEHGNHPVGVAQSQPVKDLPLAGGVVVCHTCHDPHSEMTSERGLRLEFNALCQRCHPGH